MPTVTASGKARERTAPAAESAIPWSVGTAPDGGVPLHQQVTQAITRQIEQGALPPGSMLPPEVELAQQFGVSRHTVRAGISALVRAGLLARRRGHGTFVTRPRMQQSLARFYSLAREMRTHGQRLQTLVLARGRMRPTDELASVACDELGLDDPDAVGYLRRLRLVEETPLLLEVVTFPAALCPALLELPDERTGDLGARPFYDVLAERAGIHVAHARETLRPGIVEGEDALLLQVTPGTPVLHVERASTADERPVEWRQALVRGDRFAYTVDLLNPMEEGESG